MPDYLTTINLSYAIILGYRCKVNKITCHKLVAETLQMYLMIF
jgi:hypothetical protein